MPLAFRNASVLGALLLLGLRFPYAGARRTQQETSKADIIDRDPSSKRWHDTSAFYDVHRFRFADGETLPTVRLHYRTLGKPHRATDGSIDNAVLLLHGTGQNSTEFLAPQFADPLYGPGSALDITKFFIIMPDNIGHGLSLRPSDGLRTKFPHYRYVDMVALQHSLVHEALHVDRLRLILGTSMGCMHGYVWGTTYPGEMKALMAMSCSPYAVVGENWLWRKALMDSILQDPAWHKGDYTTQPDASMRMVAMLAAIATSGAPNLAAHYPTETSVDSLVAHDIYDQSMTTDANDTLYQFAALEGYNAAPQIDRIKIPVLWWDSADDFINPPTLSYPAMILREHANFSYKLQPATPETHGHLTYEDAKFFEADIRALLARS